MLLLLLLLFLPLLLGQPASRHASAAADTASTCSPHQPLLLLQPLLETDIAVQLLLLLLEEEVHFLPLHLLLVRLWLLLTQHPCPPADQTQAAVGGALGGALHQLTTFLLLPLLVLVLLEMEMKGV